MAKSASVRVAIVGDNSSLTHALRDSQSKLSKFGGAAVKFGAVLGVSAGVGLGAIAKSAIDTEAQFGRTMNTLAAATGTPTKGMKKLNDLAIQLGQSTSFSANDAANAMLELGKAGISTKDIMGGAAKGTLLLANASGTDLQTSATIASNAMHTFNLRGKDMGKIAAALAGGANKSTASVESLGQGLAQVGPGAKNAGLNLNDTVGVLSAFDNAGIKGSDAGTSLKTMLQRLVPSTKAAKTEMKDLGLKFTDAHGKFKPITAIAQDLQDKFKGMSQEQKSAALQTIFGSDATRAATVLMKEGSKGLGTYIKATKDSNAAQDMAKARMKGTAGALERIKGVVETVQLQIGQKLAPAVQWFAGALQKAVPKIEHFIGKLSDDLQPVISTLVHFVINKAIPFIGELAKQLGRIARVSWDNLKNAAGAVKDFFAEGKGHGAMVKALELAHTAAKGLARGFHRAADDLGTLKKKVGTLDLNNLDGKKIGKALGTALQVAFKSLLDLADTLTSTLDEMLSKIDWVGLGIAMGKQVPALLVGLAAGILNFDMGSLLKGIGKHWFDILIAVVAIAFAPSKFIGPLEKILLKIPFVGRFLAVAVRWLNDLGGKLLKRAARFVGRLGREFFKGFAEHVKFPGPGVIGKVIGALKNLIPRLARFWLNVETHVGVWLLDIAKKAGEKAGRIVVRVVGALGRLAGKVKGALSGAGTWLFDAGKRIIQGLIDGIGAMFDPVKNKLGDLTSKLTSWKGPPAKDKKLLHQSGKWVIEGFANGIDAAAPMVQKSLAAVTDGVHKAGEKAATGIKVGVTASPLITAFGGQPLAASATASAAAAGTPQAPTPIAPKQTPVQVLLDGAVIADRLDLRRSLAAVASVRRTA